MKTTSPKPVTMLEPERALSGREVAVPGKHKQRITSMPELPELDQVNYSPNAFAKALGVRPGTVKRWRHEGMPSSRDGLGNVWIWPPDAIQWIRKHARPPTFEKSAVVYFARKDDQIKIGSSVAPIARLRKLRVEILVTVPGDKRTELAFHALFELAAVGNEWFRPIPELLTLIESLKAA